MRRMAELARTPDGTVTGPDADTVRGILTCGSAVRDFFLTSQRASMLSPLFNVPARMVVGGHCYFEHAGWILSELTAAATPEEIGQRMRTVCIRPNYIGLNAIPHGYLNGREQRRLLLGLRPDEPLEAESVEQTRAVLEFWERAARAYVGGAEYVPDALGYRLPLLGRERVLALAERARPPGGPEQQAAIRRMIAVTELYTFILNGEARVGVFHHGPYPLPGGEALLVKELVGLHDDFLPWREVQRPHVECFARVMRIRGVEARIDLFGSLSTEPPELDERIVAEAVLTVDAGTLRPLEMDEIAAVTDAAADAQVELYHQVMEWDARKRIAYGADLYASLIEPFARLAGLEMRERIQAAFRETAVRVAPALESGAEPPLLLERLGSSEGFLYSPGYEP